MKICNDLKKNASQICNTGCETHHTPTHITQSSLGPTLWGSVSESIQDYRAGSDTICNDPRKSFSYICAIPQKDWSQLRLIAVVNKAQFNSVNTRCGTHHTPTHITQSIKLGYHILSYIIPRWGKLSGQMTWVPPFIVEY